MKPINQQASAALEAARHDDGQFGTQNHAESGQVPAPPVYDRIRFSLESVPSQIFPAVSYGATWNGWETPIVDKATLDQMLAVSGEPYTWDGDTAVIENNDGEGERFGPLEDGTYDLGELGWTFVRAQTCRHDGCPESGTEGDVYDGWCAIHADWIFEHRRGGHAAAPNSDCPTCLDANDY